jgi:transcriptional regulator with XRE-family HTH domain
MRKTLRTPAHDLLVSLLKEKREEARLTQAEVAQRLGRPQSFVAKFEGGERRLDVIEFITVTKAIEADPLAIVGQLAPLVPRPRLKGRRA